MVTTVAERELAVDGGAPVKAACVSAVGFWFLKMSQ
jgi:hypothetical protein